MRPHARRNHNVSINA